MASTLQHTVDTEGEKARRPRRSAGLVGNRLVLLGGILFLCEFVGIIGSHVHTMPALPGTSSASLRTMYDGQAGVAGFLVGWYSLVIPGRLLFTLGLRRAILASDRSGRAPRTLLDWAVSLMGVGVVLEMASAAVLAAAAASATRGDDAVLFALDRMAHTFQVAITCPSGLALAVVAFAMWRSGVFPRMLAGPMLMIGGVQVVSGALLAGPSTASLQDSVTALNLINFGLILWAGILVFRRRPKHGTDT
jgi:hypothetical protein